jgi:hypothetical protein
VETHFGFRCKCIYSALQTVGVAETNFKFCCKCTHSALQRAGVAETHFRLYCKCSHSVLQRAGVAETNFRLCCKCTFRTTEGWCSGNTFRGCPVPTSPRNRTRKAILRFGNSHFLPSPSTHHSPISLTLDAIKFQMRHPQSRKANPHHTDFLNRRHMAFFPRNLFSDVDRLILNYTRSRQK